MTRVLIGISIGSVVSLVLRGIYTPSSTHFSASAVDVQYAWLASGPTLSPIRVFWAVALVNKADMVLIDAQSSLVRLPSPLFGQPFLLRLHRDVLCLFIFQTSNAASVNSFHHTNSHTVRHWHPIPTDNRQRVHMYTAVLG